MPTSTDQLRVRVEALERRNREQDAKEKYLSVQELNRITGSFPWDNNEDIAERMRFLSLWQRIKLWWKGRL